MNAAQHSHMHEATIDEVVITVVMARVTDFFGFFVYAIASALVFPRLFFPTFEPVTGTLLSFLIFSLAFLARPVASMSGRVIQRKIGRAGKITLALLILGASTMAIGLLPGFEKIGWWAPILLAVLRICQGLGLGGAWDGLTLQLQHSAPENRKGFYAMVPQLGGPIGFVVAASLFYVLTGFLTEEEFFTFGWRFTFFAVLAVNVVSLFARLRLLNADLGVDEELVTSAPLREMMETQWRPILLSAFLPLASYALFHMVTVFPLGITNLFTERAISDILLLQIIGGTLAVFAVIATGILADRFGRRYVLGVSTMLILVLCLMIGSLVTNPAAYILFGFVVLGLTYGQASAIVPRRFAPKYRYSGAAMATNLSWILGAAFAPLIGLGLTVGVGLWAAAIYLLSGAVVTFVALRKLAATEAAS
ncbi:MFS transporter [Epibacterium sp. SM1969]|uniref:MFS transporter n=1 Tax=Tritonibacter aquimaris TaxID=2663379 RepID=A0A844ARG4_9RHOB|nr:MFS transporter [Tritonibacter aquimaris]MQY43603.1 MFS transporter [Tritonibacter aquimaris]